MDPDGEAPPESGSGDRGNDDDACVKDIPVACEKSALPVRTAHHFHDELAEANRAAHR